MRIEHLGLMWNKQHLLFISVWSNVLNKLVEMKICDDPKLLKFFGFALCYSIWKYAYPVEGHGKNKVNMILYYKNKLITTGLLRLTPFDHLQTVRVIALHEIKHEVVSNVEKKWVENKEIFYDNISIKDKYDDKLNWNTKGAKTTKNMRNANRYLF